MVNLHGVLGEEVLTSGIVIILSTYLQVLEATD